MLLATKNLWYPAIIDIKLHVQEIIEIITPHKKNRVIHGNLASGVVGALFFVPSLRECGILGVIFRSCIQWRENANKVVHPLDTFSYMGKDVCE